MFFCNIVHRYGDGHAVGNDDEAWGSNDDAESTSGYTSASQDTVTQAEGQLSAMQNSILLLCDQVQDLRGKLTSSRPSSSKKSKFDELARAKRELVRVREENEALAMRCRELSLQQNPESLSEYQQVRPPARCCRGRGRGELLAKCRRFPASSSALTVF